MRKQEEVVSKKTFFGGVGGEQKKKKITSRLKELNDKVFLACLSQVNDVILWHNDELERQFISIPL